MATGAGYGPGTGDTLTAIRILTKLIADKQIPLQPSLVQLCTGWLEAYVLHEEHGCVRFLIECLPMTGSNLRPCAQTKSLNCTRNSGDFSNLSRRASTVN